MKHFNDSLNSHTSTLPVVNHAITSVCEKKEALKWYYEVLLNEESAWDKEGLPQVDLTKWPAVQVDSSIIDKKIKNMKAGKSPVLSGINAEMLKISVRVGYRLVTDSKSDRPGGCHTNWLV